MEFTEKLQRGLGAAYQIDRELGGGGMSRVFLAEDSALGRRVVVKVLSPDLAAGVNHERFRREIQLAARLQHSNIVPVLSAGESDGLPYYVMPYVDGESLRGRIAREGALPIDDTIAIIRDVAEALSYAHRQGVVHRDIKPDNILLGSHHAVVTDFGVAKAISASSTTSGSITSLGSTMGTPNYMAPEQAAADPNSDHRADLYALGVVAYEALAGRAIFGQRSPQAMFFAHAVETPAPITNLRADTPPAIAELVMRLLEKTPEKRPQSADEVIELLRGARGAATVQLKAFQPRRIPVRAIAALGVIVAAAAALLAVKGLQKPVPSTDRRSIAVLPFEEIGGNAADAHFGDGISEELIDALSKLRQLKVAGRTSSFAFRASTRDVKDIGNALGVGTILTGSVQRASNTIRVRAQLTDVTTGFTVWSQSYDSDPTDVFGVQDKISNAIVSALSLQLGAGEATAIKSRQTSIEAYDQYLQGMQAWNQRGSGIPRSFGFFKAAIALDSLYAPAYAGLAEAYLTATNWGYVAIADAIPIIRANAKKAVAIDSLSAEGHLALADLRCHHEYDFPGADREYAKALALNPNSVTTHYQYAWCIAGLGRFDEAIAEANRARELDPLNPQLFSALGRAYYLKGQWDEGLAAYEPKSKLPTDVASAYYWTSSFLVGRGDTAGAIAAIQKGATMSGNSPLYEGGRASIYAMIGRSDSARTIVARLARNPNPPTYQISTVYASLRDDAAALDWLDRAYAERTDWLPMMKYDRAFDRLRSNARFQAIQAKLKLP